MEVPAPGYLDFMNAVQNGAPVLPVVAGGIMKDDFRFIQPLGVIDAAGLIGMPNEDNCFEIAPQGEGYPATIAGSLAVDKYFFTNSAQRSGFVAEPLEAVAEVFGLMKLAQKGAPGPTKEDMNLVFSFIMSPGLGVVPGAVIGIPKALSCFSISGQAGLGFLGSGVVCQKQR